MKKKTPPAARPDDPVGRGRAGKIIYWIATIWLALGMTSTGIVQLLKKQADIDLMNHLGYPVYLLTILGIWKILGVIAVLIPRFRLLKDRFEKNMNRHKGIEWANVQAKLEADPDKYH